MNTADALSYLLDSQWVSALVGRPSYVSHLRVKPQVALIAALSTPTANLSPHDGEAGQPWGWLRLLWPVSHSKARKANAQAQRLGASTESRMVCEDTGLLADWGPISSDPALAPHLHSFALSQPNICESPAWPHSTGSSHPSIFADSSHIRAASVQGDEATRASTGHDAEQAVGQVLRYNPLRRLVVAHMGSVVRISAKPQLLTTEVLNILGDAVPTPPLLPTSGHAAHCAGTSAVTTANSDQGVHGQTETGHISRMAWCGQGDISTLTATAHAPAYSATAHARAGELFAQLHASTPLISRAPQGVELRETLSMRAPDVYAQAEAHARILDHLAPALAAQLRRLTDRLPQPVAPTSEHMATPAQEHMVLSHGDASADQVLATASLDHLWITDFDRVCLAHPTVDLGSYTALTTPPDTQDFLDGYAAAGGTTPTRAALNSAQVASLIARLAEPLKSGNPHWQAHMRRQLDTIEEALR